ncbi:hypothetical protein IF188_09600 [Microbacterium sp. NEAU-LLC]|uniref:CBM-cenC domain-containing protein n=1 Tax=Microbacterium helvum TaxID=2773713 RepID=A0ABR8NNF0_9MICO|nr:hypothetical protein [Microbacterium helvum]MBD3941948.1 hypothetical protein [Microbacterium helvum]
MTAAAFVYTATLQSTGDQLHIDDEAAGRIKLDAGQAPHVSCELTIARPSQAIIDKLDPRQSPPPRVLIHGTRTDAAGNVQTRDFDLHVRRRPNEQDASPLQLTLASDEALLDDYRALMDDSSALAHQDSLRAIVDGALMNAGIPYNLVLYPEAGTGSDWGMGWGTSGAGTLQLNMGPTTIDGIPFSNYAKATWTAAQTATTSQMMFGTTTSMPVTPGQAYTVSCYAQGSSIPGNWAIGVQWFTAAGATISEANSPAAAVTGSYKRWSLTATAPANAAYVRPRFRSSGAPYPQVNSAIRVTGVQLDVGSTLRPYRYRVLQPGGEDFPVPALADSQNLIRNPRAGSNTTDWAVTWASGGATISRVASGGPSYAPSYVQLYANQATSSTGVYVFIGENIIGVSPGKLYELSASANPPAGVNVTVDAILYDSNGNIVGFATPSQITGDGNWQRAGTAFFAPETAVRARVRLNVLGSLAYGVYFGITGWRLSESTGDEANDRTYFDGGTPDTAQYDYSFADAAHASVSKRTRLVDAATPDGLTWYAGRSALEFLGPIVQRFGQRLVCNERREWTLRDANYLEDGSITVRYAVNMHAGSDTIDRDAGIWYDARVVRYKWTSRAGIQYERVDAFALNTPPSLVDYLEVDAAYPGPGRAEAAVRSAQQRGRQIEATMFADLTAAAEQPVSGNFDGLPAQTGKAQSVQFDLTGDQMTLTLRSTDTPEHAWILQPAAAWTTGPVGESWTEAA